MRALSVFFAALLASASQAQDLLIADNWWDEVALALDPYDGHLIDEEYIQLPGNPGEVADSGRGTLVFSSDFQPDAILEINHEGTVLNTIASGLETFYVEVHDHFVYARSWGDLLKINMDTGASTTLVRGLTSHGDTLVRSDDLLVGSTDRILRYDHQGTLLGTFYQDPEISQFLQINPDGNGGLIAVGRRGTQRDFIETYDAKGRPIQRWYTENVSGAIRLGNGKILVTRLFDIVILDPATGGLTTVAEGLAFGNVNLVTVAEPSLLVLSLALGAVCTRRRVARGQGTT